MKRNLIIKQADQNPFPNSDSNKRYYTYDYWLKQTFGGKCVKIPLDAGFTCPNIDGKCGTGGCIYCSGRGSGDAAESPLLLIAEQYARMRARMAKKWSVERCIPYFQAHTNTYAPISVLRQYFESAIGFDGAVALNLATRADCLPEEVVEYLADLANRTVLTVELGLQTVHDTTAQLIHRGHSFAEFCDGYHRLRDASEKILTCVHLIFGLPGESREQMLESVRRVAELHPNQVKIHLLHVLRGTVLGNSYLAGNYIPMEREDYIETVVQALELLPSDIVIGRLTGDGIAEDLLAPQWSLKKVTVLNDIDKRMFSLGTWQGKVWKETCIS